MEHQSVTEITSLFGRDQFPQRHLYFFWIFYTVHQSNTVDQSDTVRICHDGRLPEYISHDQVGAFSPHSREL